MQPPVGMVPCQDQGAHMLYPRAAFFEQQSLGIVGGEAGFGYT